MLLKKSILLNKVANVKNKKSLPVLWFFTDRFRNPDPYIILNQLPKNSGVVLRDYDLPNRVVLAKNIAEICKKRSLTYIIGADAKLALEVGASGVHIPEFRNINLPYLKPNKKEWIVTSSVHNLGSLRKVKSRAVDLIFISPVFETKSHPNQNTLGTAYISRLVNRFSVFSIALGGINQHNVKLLNGSGVNGIGAISGLIG